MTTENETTETEAETAHCALCNKEVDGEDTYCYGCEHHVCDECDLAVGMMGHHELEDHKNEELSGE